MTKNHHRSRRHRCADYKQRSVKEGCANHAHEHDASEREPRCELCFFHTAAVGLSHRTRHRKREKRRDAEAAKENTYIYRICSAANPAFDIFGLSNLRKIPSSSAVSAAKMPFLNRLSEFFPHYFFSNPCLNLFGSFLQRRLSAKRDCP